MLTDSQRTDVTAGFRKFGFWTVGGCGVWESIKIGFLKIPTGLGNDNLNFISLSLRDQSCSCSLL